MCLCHRKFNFYLDWIWFSKYLLSRVAQRRSALTTIFVIIYLMTHEDWQVFTDGNVYVNAPICLERTKSVVN